MRFFHGIILSTVHYLLFNTRTSLGYKQNVEGTMMNQLVPEGVITWMCVTVRDFFELE
jgi:hypothetical protein